MLAAVHVLMGPSPSIWNSSRFKQPSPVSSMELNSLRTFRKQETSSGTRQVVKKATSIGDVPTWRKEQRKERQDNGGGGNCSRT